MPRNPVWLIHLPLSPFLAEFGLPKWAKAAFGCLFIAFVALLMKHDSPLAGKIIVGLSVALDSLLLSTLLSWSITALKLRLAHDWQPPRNYNRTAWRIMLQSLGGWMGLVPVIVFWAWGLFYLLYDHIRWVNGAALIVWAAWFALGCNAAFVKGVRYWLRARRTPVETRDE